MAVRQSSGGGKTVKKVKVVTRTGGKRTMTVAPKAQMAPGAPKKKNKVVTRTSGARSY